MWPEMRDELKKIKDPIYGYVEVPVQYITGIIDTAPFQRLRRIIQTSYAPLYPGAVHNRFAHSIGVFYLGNIAAESIKIALGGFGWRSEDTDNILKVFKLACLLHDVGHAPFSHTGEQFYLDEKNSYEKLDARLANLVGSDEFIKDSNNNPGRKAAPHEMMSAIVGISQYSQFIGDNTDDKDFFARCITGIEYSSACIGSHIKNCLISILNSNVIDVDKLDYLIRDAYYTGHGTVNIDYQRLLSSLTVVQLSDGSLKPAFLKQAVSVIENVIYAHDTERKWIQNHPTVLYDSYIVTHMIDIVSRDLSSCGCKLFSEDSLSEKGQDFEHIHISLLSDDDIIFLAKRQLSTDAMIQEYYCRKLRRHPIWKSESEYRSYITDMISGGSLLDDFRHAIELTTTYLSKNSESGVITPETIQTVENEIREIDSSIPDEADRNIQLKDKHIILKVLNALYAYADTHGLDCDFVMLTANEFISGFGKTDFTNALITFGPDMIAKVGDVVTSISAKENNRRKYFYIYYKRPDDYTSDIDKRDFSRYLLQHTVFDP